MTEFHIKRVDGGWQINGDGDIYADREDAVMAIRNHCEAENIREANIWSTLGDFVGAKS